MSKSIETLYLLHDEYSRNISNEAFSKFLRHNGFKSYGIKSELIDTINESVNNKSLSKQVLKEFLNTELRYGHHRTLYFKDITKDACEYLKSLSLRTIREFILNKGYELPTENSIVDVHYPASLHICEIEVVPNETINITFARSIYCTVDGGILKETDFAFVTIDLVQSVLVVRIRPRGNIIAYENPKVKINQNQYYYHVEKELKKIFGGLELLRSNHFKKNIYNIGTKLTERAEKKWREKVEYHTEFISKVSSSFLEKLPEIIPVEFDLEFRMKRLLERALIQSNLKELKKKETGKLGWVTTFVFSDDSGGKIKSSTKESSRAIELSELYYDTKDTIDKIMKFDKIWINWFTSTERLIETRIECTQEYYEIHFFSYIRSGDELNDVLSKIRKLAE